MSKRSRINAAMLLGMMAAMGGMSLPEPKAPKVKPVKPTYSDEDLAELDRLFQDRSSPGRKAYKMFQQELRLKYGLR